MAKKKEPDRMETMDAWLARADMTAMRAWEQSRSVLPDEEMTRTRGVGDVLHFDPGDMDRDQVRVATLEALLDFLWADGPHLLDAAKRLYHITYNVAPKLLWLMNQTKLGKMLNEGRATFNARDMRVWEEFLESRGFLGSRNHSKKSDEARENYSNGKKGNVCKRGGKKAQRKITHLRNHQPTPTHDGHED